MMNKAEKQRNVLLNIKKELEKSQIFEDVNHPNDSKNYPIENYMWVGDKENLIGIPNCHYEFIFHSKNSETLSVEVHFSEQRKQKLFQNLQFGNKLEFSEWYGRKNGRVIFKKNKLSINDPNIVKKTIKKLELLHNEIGEQLQEILSSNIDLFPKSRPVTKPVLSSNGGTIVKKKHYKSRTATVAKSLETKHGKIQEAYKQILLSKQYDLLNEEQGFDGLPYRIDILAHSGKGYDVFEIKPDSTATECIREALGQLLFYKHLLEEGGYKVNRLVVVGSAKNQESDDDYLKSINNGMNKIQIEYEYIETK